MADLPCRTIGLDWHTDIRQARAQVGSTKTLQGNADPCLLYADEETISAGVKSMLTAFSGTPHIANLGHGLYPDTDPNKVRHFINQVKAFKHDQ
jgi:uroporphyrinogen decarboxylase